MSNHLIFKVQLVAFTALAADGGGSLHIAVVTDSTPWAAVTVDALATRVVAAQANAILAARSHARGAAGNAPHLGLKGQAAQLDACLKALCA